MKIKIGGHKFELIKERKNNLSPRYDGKIDYDNNMIHINGDLINVRFEEVLAHEILHGLIAKSGSNTLLTNEENFCCGMENMFWKFLKDNTNFFEKMISKNY